jgi:hypothetical protein
MRTGPSASAPQSLSGPGIFLLLIYHKAKGGPAPNCEFLVVTAYDKEVPILYEPLEDALCYRATHARECHKLAKANLMKMPSEGYFYARLLEQYLSARLASSEKLKKCSGARDRSIYI